MDNKLKKQISRIVEISNYGSNILSINEQLPPPSKDGKVLHRTTKGSQGNDKDFMDWYSQQPHSTGKELEDLAGTLGFSLSILSGIFTGGLGWAAFGGSLLASAIEIKSVLNRGNDYEAGFLFVCTILNFDDVGKLLGGKFYSERFLKWAFEYVKKGGKFAANSKLSGFLKRLIEKLPQLLKMSNSKIVKSIISNIPKLFETKSISWIVGFFYKILKNVGKLSTTIGQAIFPIVGGYITFDQLYKLIYGSDKEKMALRGLSIYRQLVNKLINGEELPEIKQKMQSIVMGELSKVSEEEFLKASSKAYEDPNFESSLVDKPSKYSLLGQFSENSKKIAEEFYDSISGLGTNEHKLLNAIDKIKTPSLFDEVNIYLYKKYGENIYDLLNSPLELEYEEKEKIISHFLLNKLKGVRIILSDGVFKPYTN